MSKKKIDKVFISFSFGEDEIIAESISRMLRKRGYKVFSNQAFSTELRYVGASKDDLERLRSDFLEAGLNAPEHSEVDSALFDYLVNYVMEYDIVIILWSRNYVKKFWTRIEWKTALSICKPTILLRLDATPLDPSLAKASFKKTFQLIEDYKSFTLDTIPSVIEEIADADENSKDKYLGEDDDELINQPFIRLQHPLLGYFEMGKFQITNQVVERFLPAHKNLRSDTSWLDDQPANFINWVDANHLCELLTHKSEKFDYRLPTEIEWEFAARANERTLLGIPEHELIDSFAVVQRKQTARVGSKKPNAWGLFDVIGNVAEWCLDPCDFYEYNGWVNAVVPRKLSGDLWGAYAVRGAWFGERIDSRFSASYPIAEPTLNASEAVGLRLVRQTKRRYAEG